MLKVFVNGGEIEIRFGEGVETVQDWLKTWMMKIFIFHLFSFAVCRKLYNIMKVLFNINLTLFNLLTWPDLGYLLKCIYPFWGLHKTSCSWKTDYLPDICFKSCQIFTKNYQIFTKNYQIFT